MTSNPPNIFRASEIPKNFPFDISIVDDYSGDQECPQCFKPYFEHTDRQFVVCARKRLKGEKG